MAHGPVLEEGKKINDATMPTGGRGILGWLSAIWYKLTQGIGITSVPTDPFGANADASSATGSLAAKTRLLASAMAEQTGSGSVTANGQSVSITSLVGKATLAIQVTGTWVGTLNVEGSIDGTNYTALFARMTGDDTTGRIRTTYQIDGSEFSTWFAPIAGLASVRLRSTAWTSGTAVVTLRASSAAPPQIGGWVNGISPSPGYFGEIVHVASAPTGVMGGVVSHDSPVSSTKPVLIGGHASAAAPTNVSTDADAVMAWHLLNGAYVAQLSAAGALIGGDAANGLDVDVTRVGGTVAVTGTFWQATQPVSGTFWQATQPVSIAATVTVDTELPAAATLADGASLPSTPKVGAVGMQYNGSTLDLEYGNTDILILASATRTSTTYSADITNHNGSALTITWDVTANPSAGNVKLRIQYKDSVSGKYEYIHADWGNISSAQTVTFVLGLGAQTTGGDVNQVTSYALPRVFRIEVVHAGGSSITYSVGASITRG